MQLTRSSMLKHIGPVTKDFIVHLKKEMGRNAFKIIKARLNNSKSFILLVHYVMGQVLLEQFVNTDP